MGRRAQRMDQEDMREFTLLKEQIIDRPIEDVFAFYGNAANLERLTPPWLRFEILTPDVPMQVGATIDYRIKMHGLPMRWTSEITAWDPPHRFVDEQRRGPYRYWIHTHEFETHPDGTLVRDFVRYAVPGGRLVHRLFVAPDLRKIFDYRRTALADVFADSK